MTFLLGAVMITADPADDQYSSCDNHDRRYRMGSTATGRALRAGTAIRGHIAGSSTRRLAVVSLVAGLVAGAGASVAMADSTSSGNSYYQVAGVWYYNWESMTTYSASASTDAWAETENGSNVGTGWMGASTDLDTSNGSLCSRSGWGYNGSPSNVYVNQTANYCGAAYYYGIGATQGWNGSGYTGYYTNRTTNLYVN